MPEGPEDPRCECGCHATVVESMEGWRESGDATEAVFFGCVC